MHILLLAFFMLHFTESFAGKVEDSMRKVADFRQRLINKKPPPGKATRLGFGKTNSSSGVKAASRPKFVRPYRAQCHQKAVPAESVPAFWVNLDKSVNRKRYFTDQMQQMGLKHKRIRALTADEVKGNMTRIGVSSSIQHTPHELACVASHLLAIHSAVHDETVDPANPYALIVEDDVSFEMDVDFKTLAESAPKNFGILQLMTSNGWEVYNLWTKYKKKPDRLDMWTKREWNSGYWSTQGYLINKANVRPFIDKAVTVSHEGRISLNIINPSPKQFPCRGNSRCVLPFRIVADIYIFTACGPSYMANIPVFNGAHVGQNSTIHYRKNNDVSHAKAFAEIDAVLDDVRNSTALVPQFIRKKTCIPQTKARYR